MTSCLACDGSLPEQRYQGNPQKWCSESCRAWARHHPGERRQTNPCARCGAVLPPLKRVYCSTLCSEIASGARRDPAKPRVSRLCTEPGCEKPHRRQGYCKYHARKHFPAPCELAYARKRNQLKNHVRRGRLLAPDAEMIDRDVVGDRDRWRCGICHQHVDRRKAYPHPRSASLDHIIPQSQDGPHTYANVRISHLDCNVARSNLGGGEQLALFG